MSWESKERLGSALVRLVRCLADLEGVIIWMRLRGFETIMRKVQICVEGSIGLVQLKE